jgi:hypothetical protein
VFDESVALAIIFDKKEERADPLGSALFYRFLQALLLFSW